MKTSSLGGIIGNPIALTVATQIHNAKDPGLHLSIPSSAHIIPSSTPLAASMEPLRATTIQGLRMPTTYNATDLGLTYPPNTSISDLTVPGLGSLEVTCDGARYGMNPNVRDCDGARGYFIPDMGQKTFGERHTGLPDTIFPLPYILFGDRAECFFQPINIGGGPTARASLNQVRSAASAIFMQCASSEPSTGGIARNIGGDNNLAVIMSKHDASAVRCRGTFDGGNSCLDVLADMPASKELTIFGSRGRLVQQRLPREIESSDGKCVVKLFQVSPKSSVASWYQIWEAVEATHAVCARVGKGGFYAGLGHDGDILMSMGGRRVGDEANSSLVETA